MNRPRTDHSQLVLMDVEVPLSTDTSTTFSDNLGLPIHRWFRYSAGFSAAWVADVIHEEKRNGRSHVLDPFGGSGTVLLVSESEGVEGTGIEAHPFVARVAAAKLHWRADHRAFLRYANDIFAAAKSHSEDISGYPALIHDIYPPHTLGRLDKLRRAWLESADGSPQSELIWLALAGILRDCSPSNTANTTYVLPSKAKANSQEPFEAFRMITCMFASDMARRQAATQGPAAVLHRGDARDCQPVPDGWANLVITSPPYANNFDYADATRVEMSFFGDVSGWADLQGAVRQYLVRSCSQHVSGIYRQTHEILADEGLDPIRDEIESVVHELGEVRLTRGGKKTYHTMVAAYFSDMAKVWRSMRRVTAPGGLLCFVVGDSAPYGVHVPVDRWMGQLALASGFHSFRFEKTRDRNVKWKNRKHRVPLNEGRLWVEG